MGKKTALILGGTGLIGKSLLELLLSSEEYDKVVAIGRRNIDVIHPKLQQHTISLEELDKHKDLFRVSTVFCALGTTMKKAKSKASFRRVDFDYPLQAARLAKSSGVEQFIIVTAMGADSKSMFFYSRVKGEIEEELKRISFNRLLIVRPSLLIGNRDERRLGEDIGQFFAEKTPFMFRLLAKKYQPNLATTVASAMYQLSLQNYEGAKIIESLAIEQVGGNLV